MAYGTVDCVQARTVNTKYGPKPVYDLMIDGEKFSWGFKPVPAKVGITDGAEIEFDFTPDKYGPKIDVDSVVVKAVGTGKPATSVASPSAGKSAATGTGGGTGFPVPVTSDKISIARQNALTNARELVTAYSDTFGCSGDGDKLVATILEVAGKFADYTTGRDVEAKVAKLSRKME